MNISLVVMNPMNDNVLSSAVCTCRLTANQIVIESGKVTTGRNTLGGLPYRFNRKTGLPIPHRRGYWRLAAGELDRLKREFPLT